MAPGEILVTFGPPAFIVAALFVAILVKRRRHRKSQKQDNSLASTVLELLHKVEALEKDLNVGIDPDDSQLAVGEVVTLGNMIARVCRRIRKLEQHRVVVADNVSEDVAELKRRLKVTESNLDTAVGIIKDNKTALREERAKAFTEFRRHMEEFVQIAAHDAVKDEAENIAKSVIDGVAEDDFILNKLREKIIEDIDFRSIVANNVTTCFDPTALAKNIIEDLLSDISFADRLKNSIVEDSKFVGRVKHKIASDTGSKSFYKMVEMTINQHLIQNREKIVDMLFDEVPLEVTRKPRIQTNSDAFKQGNLTINP